MTVHLLHSPAGWQWYPAGYAQVMAQVVTTDNGLTILLVVTIGDGTVMPLYKLGLPPRTLAFQWTPAADIAERKRPIDGIMMGKLGPTRVPKGAWYVGVCALVCGFGCGPQCRVCRSVCAAVPAAVRQEEGGVCVGGGRGGGGGGSVCARACAGVRAACVYLCVRVRVA